MGLIDKFFGRKKKPTSIRQYAAAQKGRLLADFLVTQKSADSEIYPALRIVRDRCRDVARNNDYAKRYLQLMTTNVVGSTGVRVQVRGRNADRSLDAPGNSIIENAWSRWGSKGICTMDGKLSWLDCQRLFIETLCRDGEVLVQKVKNRNLPHGFAIHFIEADYLDDQYNLRATESGNEIRMGVEIDKYGKAVAYHLLENHPGADIYAKPTNVVRKRIPAEELIHVYLRERPHQTRGMPSMTTALTRLKMLDGYEEAELVAARVAAAKMGFFTSPGGDGYVGSDLEDTHNPVMEAQPGMFEQLPAGMTFQSFDPQHPVSAFAEFEKAVLRGIASGLGVNYVSLANNLEGVSYSSIRQGTMEDRDHYRMMQQFMIEHFIEPIFKEWLLMVMTKSAIPIPDTKYDKFADNLIFRARGWNWVDPLKEIQAHVVGLQNGIVTMQDIAAHYGRDVEEVFEQLESERELAEAYGIKTAFQPFGEKAPAPPLVVGEENPNGNV
jgi:lambda family phage portal protein